MPKSYNDVFVNVQQAHTDYTYDAKGVMISSRDTEYRDTTRHNSRFFSGTTYPNWKAFRKLHGWLPVLPCTDRQTRTEGIPTTLYYLNLEKRLRRKSVVKYPHNLPAPQVASPEMDNAVNVAWSKLRRKVMDQDFNIAVTAAEGRKTIDMITQSATKLARAYKAFRSGRLYDAGKILGVTPSGLPNSWLAYKYGWTPLLLDIHGGAKTLAELGHKRDQRTMRASHSYTVKSPIATFKFAGDRAGKATAFCTFRVRSPGTKLMNSIGLLNPALILWEVIPFSFVVDWFINIGDCIQEATAFSGVHVLCSGTTRRVWDKGTLSQDHGPGVGASSAKISNYEFTRVSELRQLPRLAIRNNPFEKDDISSLAKFATAVSLLANASGMVRDLPKWGR